MNIYKFDKLMYSFYYSRTHDKDGEVKGANTVVFKTQRAKPFNNVQHTIHGVNNDPQVYFTDV